MSSYGRRRESIADLEVQISDVFSNHPEAHFNDEDTPVIPAHALPGVISELSLRNGVEILDAREQKKVEEFVRDNPVIEVTPELLLGFMAMATAKVGDARNSSPELAEDTTVRGRAEARRFSGNSADSRSSSRDSDGTSVWYRESRTRSPDSPFEAKSRKRSAPLSGPPSSWNKRPVPPQRRRSDVGFGGSMSDTESMSPTLRASPRTRVPSTPTSPSSRVIGSPILPPRPHSRAASDATFSIDHSVRRFSSLSPSAVTSSIVGLVSPPPERDNVSSPLADDSADIISSLAMPMAHGSDSDSDGDGDETHRLSMGLILDHDRSVRSSVVSLEPHDRLDALQKNNQDLARRLVEAERTLQTRLTDHEIEIDEMQSKVDELKAELAATKREEKELRSKERQNSQQIQSLESELVRVQKLLVDSRTAHHTASKQWSEQCEVSEKYRNILRLRDQEIKDLEDAAQLHQLEVQKWAQQREVLENAHLAIEQDLSIARQTQVELDEQKQENLVLKETIDRLRFDLDELRTRETHTPRGGVGGTPFGSVSKSLGAELMNRWNALSPDDVNDEQQQQEEEDDGSTTDGEEMIQTIITRKKRRVGGGSKVVEFKETKEYSDAYTQHEISEVMPPTAEAGVSTVSASVESLGMQTDPEPAPEPKPLLASTEVQTEPEPTADDELGSSSSTLIPPTPKPEPLPRDAPPSYDQTLDREALMRALEGYELDYGKIKGPLRAELKIAEATLRQWHKGASVPIAPLPQGVSPEVVEEWARLKKELGAECMVLDKIIAASKQVARTQKEAQQQPPPSPKKPTSRSRRFYNIYNTYFFNKAESGATASSYVAPVLIGFLCSTVVLLALSPASTPYGAVPGMPTYQDRAYWTAFHALDMAGEGFGGGAKSSSDAVWSVLERLLLGSADVVRRANIPS